MSNNNRIRVHLSDMPGLIKEWDYERNGKKSPERILLHSRRYAYWCCTYGHKWMASPQTRSSGMGCPYCAALMLYKDSPIRRRWLFLLQDWKWLIKKGHGKRSIHAGGSK